MSSCSGGGRRFTLHTHQLDSPIQTDQPQSTQPFIYPSKQATDRSAAFYLGDEGAVPAVHHEDVRALPLGHLLRGGRRAHARGVGVVEALGDGPAVDGDAKEGLLVGVALGPEEVAGDLDWNVRGVGV